MIQDNLIAEPRQSPAVDNAVATVWLPGSTGQTRYCLGITADYSAAVSALKTVTLKRGGTASTGPYTATVLSLGSTNQNVASTAFTFAQNGSRLLVSVKTGGAVSVSDAAPSRSASAAKKKRTPLLKASTTAGQAPMITVPLRLTKTGKSQLEKKGKLKVTARITFNVLGFGASTQTAKLTIKGKTGKK